MGNAEFCIINMAEDGSVLGVGRAPMRYVRGIKQAGKCLWMLVIVPSTA